MAREYGQNKVKSQKLIDLLVKARRENPNITQKELEYIAYRFRYRNS